MIAFCHSDDPFYYRLLTYYEPVINAIVAVSDTCGRRLTELMPHRADDIHVKPYFVSRPEKLSKRYSSADSPIKIVYGGRIVQKQKRVLDLITLANKLDETQVNFQLEIVGDGLDAKLLRDRIATQPASVRCRIKLVGALEPDALMTTLDRSDIAVLVSEHEGTSVFMLEAMSRGCVPVVTEVSGVDSVIDHGKNGFFHAVGDLAAMGRDDFTHRQ